MGRPKGSKNKTKSEPATKPVPAKKVTKAAKSACKKVTEPPKPSKKFTRPKLDPKIQRGLWPRYHAPQLLCPVCGSDGVQVDNKPHHPTKTLERFFQCSDGRHSWADVRKMGTGERV
jgi:hypothetical protein